MFQQARQLAVQRVSEKVGPLGDLWALITTSHHPQGPVM